MKKYEKPTIEIIQLRVQENLANTPGNVTVYNMSDPTKLAMEMLSTQSTSTP